MRNVVLWMQMSADGYMSGPGGAFDWPVGGEELFDYFLAGGRSADLFMYGRRVYEMMAGYWPAADAGPESTGYSRAYAPIWRETDKIVFSTSLERADWNTRVVGGDIPGEIARLKQQPGGDMVLFGGAETAATFMAHDLIDEYRLFVHPVVLGGGTRLFGELDDRTNLWIVEARTFDSAVVLLRYHRATG